MSIDDTYIFYLKKVLFNIGKITEFDKILAERAFNSLSVINYRDNIELEEDNKMLQSEVDQLTEEIEELRKI